MKKAPQNTFTFNHEGKQFYARVFNAGHKAVDPLTLSKYFDKRTEVLTSENQMQKQWAKYFSNRRDDLLLMNQELQAKIKNLEDANLMKTADVAYQIEQKEKVETELGEKCEELRDLEKKLKDTEESYRISVYDRDAVQKLYEGTKKELLTANNVIELNKTVFEDMTSANKELLTAYDKVQNELNAQKNYIKNLKISAWVAVGVLSAIAIGALGYISYITQ
jgi:hypothetical protein